MVTLEDIALEVGCSVNTVSRALNNKPDVSKETRKKVLEAAKKLGYVPNTLAKSLVTRMSGTIGVVLPTVSNPLYAGLLGAIERNIASYNYSMILAQSEGIPANDSELFELLWQKRVDGLLIVPDKRILKGLDAITRYNSLPIVFVLNDMPELDHSFVGIDIERAAYVSAKHLLGKGRRRIAVMQDEAAVASGAFLAGYSKALQEYGLDLNDDLVINAKTQAHSGYEQCKLLLQKNRFDAVILANDILFPGVYQALRESGATCPEDVAVIGCGNIDLCRYFQVALTSNELHIEEIGVEALQVLMDLIKAERLDEEEAEPSQFHKRIVKSSELVIRDSCGR